MAPKTGSIKSPAALGAKLGIEVVGESIKGVFGLASATVTAAGEAVKGVGMAVGGALQGALSPAPVTIINSVGMTGGAGKAKVTGGGTIPIGPKKSAKPAVNSKMATEKLLVVAVNYLSSIEKTLVDQLNFERIAASQQAQAQRENAIESGGESASPYKSLGEKLGAIKEAGADKVATATKVILGGAALASLGLLGLGELDTTELDQLKQNWKEFQDNIEPMLEVVRKVQEFIGDEASLGAAIGLAVAGPKGGIIGLIAGLVYGLTGSPELAAAAGGAGIVLAVSKKARVFTGNAAKAAGRAAGRSAYNLAGKAVVELITNPAARLATAAGGLATAATGSILYGIDQAFKYTAGSAIGAVEKYEQRYGLFVQETQDEGGGVLSRVKYKIKINERKINYFNVPKKEIEGTGHNEKERFYYWNQVHLAATQGRFGSGPAAANWLQTQGPAWLNKRFPIKTNATPAPASTTTPDATAAPSSPASPDSSAASPATPTTSAPAGQNKTITGVVEGGAGYTTVIYADGTTERRGGTLPARTNNPGNIMDGPLARSYGSVGSSPSTNGPPVAVFPTREAGFVAMDGLLTSQYSNGPIGQTLENWATDPDHPAKVIGTAGVDPNKKYTDFTHDEKVRFMQALAKVEGFYAAGSGPKISSADLGNSDLLSSAIALGKGAMEAIGTVLRAGLGKMTPTTGSQLSGFNDTMRGNTSSATSVQGESTTTAQLARTSAQIQNAVDLGNADAAQAATQQESAGASSIRQANASNDGKLECLDPNSPGNGAVEAYLQYHRLAA